MRVVSYIDTTEAASDKLENKTKIRIKLPSDYKCGWGGNLEKR